MSFSTSPWDASKVKSSQEAASYCRCCLIDTNKGGDKIKDNCKLPVVSTPGGPYNWHAMAAAAVALAGGRTPLQAPADAKRKAARKLVGLYRQFKKEPPASLLRIAGMRQPKEK
jgi:hypothetical protein